MTAATVLPLLNRQLRDLETRISGAESTGVLARWEFGRLLLGQRAGRKLPAGLLATVGADLGVSRTELQKRMRFAEKYPTEEEMRNALRNYGSWHRIVGEALPDDPKPRTLDAHTLAVLKRVAAGRGPVLHQQPRLLRTVHSDLTESRRYLRDALRQLEDGATLPADYLNKLVGEVDKVGALVDRVRAELAKRQDSP
jgi:hypothetical protein